MASPRDELAAHPDKLRRRLDPKDLPFATTAEVAPLEGTIGQPRAMDAIAFGLEVSAQGYNLFVSGAEGSGRETTAREHVERWARSQKGPPDWLYVFGFDEPHRPRALRLPAGRGVGLARDMDEFVEAAQREIPRAFESENYEKRQREALASSAERRNKLLEELRAFVRERSFAIETTETGFAIIPLYHGQPIPEETFQRLTIEEREQFEKNHEEIQARAATTLRQMHELEKEGAERVRQLDEEVAKFALGPLFEELRQKYVDQPDVARYLERVASDLPKHLDDFRGGAQTGSAPDDGDGEDEDGDVTEAIEQLRGLRQKGHLARYRVNVLVDNGRTDGAPVVFERNPTLSNLLGRIDHRASLGAMVTDFGQIKAGALHRANGGFLLVRVLDLLTNPGTWDALKRALLGREIRIESLAEQFIPTATIQPEPIGLDVKLVLIGTPDLYQLLYHLDEDFRELFKVKVDFAPDMAWTSGGIEGYAAFISRRVKEQGLRHFDREAVASVIEYGARLREDQRKLSTRLRPIADLVTEASFWAGKAGRDVVTAADVEQALVKCHRRSNLAEERYQELFDDGTILLDVGGEKVGQVNGLAVYDLGDYAFGRPSRVTASVSIGRGTVRSIEREIQLSGPIHSKGVFILSGYLASRYAQDMPLAIAATIAFEQSYDEIEGDSASSTELYALLSALSGLPIDQGIAVTGSVNQWGEVQPIGGVNEKIEGFFAVCKARGLSGKQGVAVPATNLPHLMLDREVVDAVRDGRFHVWGLRTIDDGISLLTGRDAGARGPSGRYPEGTVHRLVEDQLRRYSEQLRRFSTGG